MSQFLTNKNDIQDWLHSMYIFDYQINPDNTVDVGNSIGLRGKNFTSLPVKFGKIEGSFNCSNNNLTSLEGCPRIIVGNLSLLGNKLISLDFLPQEVVGNIMLNGNSITFGVLGLLLVDGVKRIGGLNIPNSKGDKSLVEILYHHMDHGRDIFACQQDLIDAGFEQYATL